MNRPLDETRRLFFQRRAYLEKNGGLDGVEHLLFGSILSELIFTLLKQPSASKGVAELLNSLPDPVTAKMREYLPEFRHSDGGWRWPPFGGQGGNTVSIPGPAKPEHVKAYDLLVDLLETRARSSA